MTLFDLLFLASFFFVVVCLAAIAILALRARHEALRRWLNLLFGYLALYAIALILTSLLTPRRVYPPGERRCWDDWCATAVSATRADSSATSSCPVNPDKRVWLVQIEVSSVAKRVRQSAPDARAELENSQGARYSPCGSPVSQRAAPAHALSDFLNAGDSFSVLLPFQLPADRQPAGIVMHHGDGFPGIVIIHGDASFLHARDLQQVAVAPQN